MEVDIKVDDYNSNYDISNSYVYLQSNCVSFFPLAKIVHVVVRCVTDYSNDLNNTRELYDKQSVPNEMSDDGTKVIINTLITRRWYDEGYGPFQDDFENTIMNAIHHAAILYYEKFGVKCRVKHGDNPQDFPKPIMLVIKELFGKKPYIGEIVRIDTDTRGDITIKTASADIDFQFRQLICAYAIEPKELNQDNHEND